MLYRPNSHLVDAMNLCWTGHEAGFVDSDGMLVAFDPCVNEDDSAALLMREKSLAHYLDETGLALVWAIVGQ